MSLYVRYVDHTYRDYSRYIENGGQLIKHKKSEKNFPAKVHKMISDQRHSNVITWMPHGRAFQVLNRDLLISSVLPEYIVCKKYKSFTRQLNAWGFKRLYQSGPDFGAYYHECFLRGIPKLTTLIRRLPPNQGKTTPYPAGEPNFYVISQKYPLPDASGATAVAAPSAGDQQETQQPSASATKPSASVASGIHGDDQLKPSAKESVSEASAKQLTEEAKMGAAASHEQDQPASSTLGSAQEGAASATMPYEYPHMMPHYSQDYYLHQSPYPPQAPYSASYLPANYYEQHPRQQQYQYQASQPQQYGYPPRPAQYRYPSPQPPQYQYPPPNIATSESNSAVAAASNPSPPYDFIAASQSSRRGLDPPGSAQTSRGLEPPGLSPPPATRPPEPPTRHENDSPTIEPLPYTYISPYEKSEIKKRMPRDEH